MLGLIELLSAMPKMVYMMGYVTGVTAFQEPLTAQMEQYYLEEYKKGDTKARNILIERNLRLVAHVVKKYTSSDIDTDDLISIGTIGLIKAIGTYNCDKGTRLATYAAKCIDNEILMSLRAGKKRQNEVFLQDSVGKDKEGNEIKLIDRLSNTDDSIFDEVDMKMQIKCLYENMKYILTNREKRVIELRYGLCGTRVLTQHDVAKKLKISRSYVSRIEKKAIEKLKDALGDK